MRADVLNNLFSTYGRLTTDGDYAIPALQPSPIRGTSRSDISNHHQHVAIIGNELKIARRLAIDRQRLRLNSQIQLLAVSIDDNGQ